MPDESQRRMKTGPTWDRCSHSRYFLPKKTRFTSPSSTCTPWFESGVSGRMDHSGRAGWVALALVGDSQLTGVPQSNCYRLNSWSHGLDLLGQAWLTAGGLSSALSRFGARWRSLSGNGICLWLTSLTINPPSPLLEHSPSTPTWQYMDLILKRSEASPEICCAIIAYETSAPGPATAVRILFSLEALCWKKHTNIRRVSIPPLKIPFHFAVDYQPREIVIRKMTLQLDTGAWSATQQTLAHIITAMKILTSTLPLSKVA